MKTSYRKSGIVSDMYEKIPVFFHDNIVTEDICEAILNLICCVTC